MVLHKQSEKVELFMGGDCEPNSGFCQRRSHQKILLKPVELTEPIGLTEPDFGGYRAIDAMLKPQKSQQGTLSTLISRYELSI